MSNLSQFFGASATLLKEDPMSQIAFAQYSGGTDNLFPVIGLYNHRLEMVGRYMTPGGVTDGAGYNSQYWPHMATSEFTNYMSAAMATALVTTSPQYPEQGGGAAAVMNGPLGHKQFRCPTSMDNAGSGIASTFKYRQGMYATTCGATFGLDQHYNLFTRYNTGLMLGANAGFYIRPNTAISATLAAFDNQASAATGAGAMDFDFSSYSAATSSRVNLQATGLMSSGGSIRAAIGGVSYNQRSKTLCILERTDSAGSKWHPVICKNAPDPADYIGKEVAYQAALTTACAVSGNRIVGPAGNIPVWHSYSHNFGRAILCDDNSVYYFEESTGVASGGQGVVKWSMNAGGTAYLAQDAASIHSNANNWAVPNHSTYTGDWIGHNEYQQSLDGETVITYCCPYYYHGAFRYVLINLKTGKATKLETAQDTANSWSVAAFGARNFYLTRNLNSDGPGNYGFVLNWESYDRFNGGAGTYTGLENTKLINQQQPHVIDTPGNSTDYGGLWRNVDYDNRAIVLAANNKFNPGAKQSV